MSKPVNTPMSTGKGPIGMNPDRPAMTREQCVQQKTVEKVMTRAQTFAKGKSS